MGMSWRANTVRLMMSAWDTKTCVAAVTLEVTHCQKISPISRKIGKWRVCERKTWVKIRLMMPIITSG